MSAISRLYCSDLAILGVRKSRYHGADATCTSAHGLAETGLYALPQVSHQRRQLALDPADDVIGADAEHDGQSDVTHVTSGRLRHPQCSA